MQFSATALLLALATFATAAPSDSPSFEVREAIAEPDVAPDSDLMKRASWTFTPYFGKNTCTGAASAFVGSSGKTCTNINDASAVTITTSGCTVSRWSGKHCVNNL